MEGERDTSTGRSSTASTGRSSTASTGRSSTARNGTSAIHAEGLVRKFGDNVAVDGVDLTVARGEIYGVLGPNGAGKTTTLRMLATLIGPDGGEATITRFRKEGA